MKLSPKTFLAVAITAIASFWVWLAISDVRDNAFPEQISSPQDEAQPAFAPSPQPSAEAGTQNSSLTPTR